MKQYFVSQVLAFLKSFVCVCVGGGGGGGEGVIELSGQPPANSGHDRWLRYHNN